MSASERYRADPTAPALRGGGDPEADVVPADPSGLAARVDRQALPAPMSARELAEDRARRWGHGGPPSRSLTAEHRDGDADPGADTPPPWHGRHVPPEPDHDAGADGPEDGEHP